MASSGTKPRWYNIILNYLCCCFLCRNKEVKQKQKRGSIQPLLNKQRNPPNQNQETQVGANTEDPSSSNQDQQSTKKQSKNDKKNNSKEPDSSNVEIIDVDKDMDNLDPDALGIPKQSQDYIHEIEKRAKTFEDQVKKYHGTNYSLEYYKLSENLSRYIDYLDTVKAHGEDQKELLQEKIRVIKYIKELQTILESKVTEK